MSAPKIINVLAISGSLRKASANSGLVRYAMKIGNSRNDVSISTFDIGKLPLFNEDLNDDAPEVVKQWREAVKKADAIFIASPEYNYSMTAALKNALDWPSYGTNLWKGKVGAIVGAGGGAGTVRSQLALRQTSVFLDITYVNSPEVVINRFADPSVFDSDGNLVGEVWQERVENIFDRMIRLATKMSS